METATPISDGRKAILPWRNPHFLLHNQIFRIETDHLQYLRLAVRDGSDTRILQEACTPFSVDLLAVITAIIRASNMHRLFNTIGLIRPSGIEFIVINGSRQLEMKVTMEPDNLVVSRSFELSAPIELSPSSWFPQPLGNGSRRLSLSPSWLTRVAVFVAGRKRTDVHEEWRSHLAVMADRGHGRREQVRAARSFILAAVRLRLQDTADLAWQAVDAVLRSRTKSNIFVWLPVLGMVLAVVMHEGWYGLIANAENLIETWIALYAAVTVGRWYRKVKPQKPKPHRAKE